MKESLNLKIRQILLDIVCALIIGLVIFFFAGGFAWDMAEDFFGSLFSLEFVLGLFIFVSLLSALATSICRLFRIRFSPRKAEKRIAGVYICLTILGVYPLMIVSAFAIFTFSPEASQWLIARNQLSVLGMILSVFWLAVLSAKLLVRTRRQTILD